MTKQQIQKYNNITRRIVRRRRVTAAETMWVWRMRPAYLAWYARRTA